MRGVVRQHEKAKRVPDLGWLALDGLPQGRHGSVVARRIQVVQVRHPEVVAAAIEITPCQPGARRGGRQRATCRVGFGLAICRQGWTAPLPASGLTVDAPGLSQATRRDRAGPPVNALLGQAHPVIWVTEVAAAADVLLRESERSVANANVGVGGHSVAGRACDEIAPDDVPNYP